MFKRCEDTALKDVVNGHSGDGLVLGLVILMVFYNLNDSMDVSPSPPQECAPFPVVLSRNGLQNDHCLRGPVLHKVW